MRTSYSKLGILLLVIVFFLLPLETAVAQDDSNWIEESINEYSRAIEANPKNISAYIGRGSFYYDLGEYELAITDFTVALKLDSLDDEIYNDRGNAFRRLGEHDLAMSDFNRALELDPQDAGTYNSRGNAYADLGDYDLALGDYDRAIELSPDFDEAYNNRALVHSALGDFESALSDHNRSIEIDPLDSLAHYNRANVYADMGDYDRAIEDLNYAIELDPEKATPYLNRGFYNNFLENYDSAMADYYQWAIRNEQETITQEILPGELTHLAMIEGRAYHISFEGQEGMNLNLSATQIQGAIDPLVIVLNSHGELMAFNDDIGEFDWDAAINDYIIPKDDTYILIVTHAGGGYDGTVELIYSLSD
jgi:tetratricopeptide (TPR) repeat protein